MADPTVLLAQTFNGRVSTSSVDVPPGTTFINGAAVMSQDAQPNSGNAGDPNAVLLIQMMGRLPGSDNYVVLTETTWQGGGRNRAGQFGTPNLQIGPPIGPAQLPNSVYFVLDTKGTTVATGFTVDLG